MGNRDRWSVRLRNVQSMPYLIPAPDAPTPTQTAVIVPVAAADRLVDKQRRQLDAASSWGVPAHVTVLFPFVAPDQIDHQVVSALAAAVQTVAAFDCVFARTGWFGEDAMWLNPEPAQPFRDLTAAVHRAFPGHAPYGGVHDEVVPHLTVAERRLADMPALRAAERAVLTGLPLRARIERVLLIAGSNAPNSWRPLQAILLGSTSIRARP